LSANEQITPTGWYQILLAIAASSRLKSFYADYNTIDDVCGYLLVAIIASTTTLEIIDLEHTRLTNASAKLFCYVIENYPVSLQVHLHQQSTVILFLPPLQFQKLQKLPFQTYKKMMVLTWSILKKK
jgi:hypothetical protein